MPPTPPLGLFAFSTLARRPPSSSPEREAAEAAAAGLRPTLAQAAALAAEGEELPVDAGLKSKLEDVVRAGEDWEERAAAVLNPRWVRASRVLGICIGLLPFPLPVLCTASSSRQAVARWKTSHLYCFRGHSVNGVARR